MIYETESKKTNKINYFQEMGIFCKCGYNKFKTVEKGKKYSCRKCGEIRHN